MTNDLSVCTVKMLFLEKKFIFCLSNAVLYWWFFCGMFEALIAERAVTNVHIARIPNFCFSLTSYFAFSCTRWSCIIERWKWWVKQNWWYEELLFDAEDLFQLITLVYDPSKTERALWRWTVTDPFSSYSSWRMNSTTVSSCQKSVHGEPCHF